MKKIEFGKPSAQEIEQAKEFAKTPRGQLLFGQALALASKVLKENEPSNSDDMDYLGKTLFGIWYHIYSDEGQRALQDTLKDKKVDEQVAKT